MKGCLLGIFNAVVLLLIGTVVFALMVRLFKQIVG